MNQFLSTFYTKTYVLPLLGNYEHAENSLFDDVNDGIALTCRLLSWRSTRDVDSFCYFVGNELRLLLVF